MLKRLSDGLLGAASSSLIQLQREGERGRESWREINGKLRRNMADSNGPLHGSLQVELSAIRDFVQTVILMRHGESKTLVQLLRHQNYYSADLISFQQLVSRIAVATGKDRRNNFNTMLSLFLYKKDAI